MRMADGGVRVGKRVANAGPAEPNFEEERAETGLLVCAV